MADLRNCEVAVDFDKNRSVFGPAGTRKRSVDSAYLHVGGSRDIYGVTINFKTGHFCTDGGGSACKGNLHGKGQKYGSIGERNTRDPQQWCKHVQAALAAHELLAQAQEITAHAFGETPKKAQRKRKVTRVADLAPQVAEKSDAERLAALVDEADALRRSIAKERTAEAKKAVFALVEKYGYVEIEEALREAPA